MVFSIKIYQCKNLKNNNTLLHKIDAVVVLTGYRGRIEEAFKFIHLSNINYVIISGANPNSSRQDILLRYSFYKKYFNKVIIEHFSKNTIENALEVKKIVKRKKIKNFLIVTSCTHIMRAKFIFNKIFGYNKKNIYYWKTKEKITLLKLFKEELKYLFDFYILTVYHLQ